MVKNFIDIYLKKGNHKYMIVSDGYNKYIFVYNKTFAPLEKYWVQNEIISNNIEKYFSTPIDICPKKCYKFSIGDVEFHMFALYLAYTEDGEERLYFLIKVKDVDRKICFEHLKLFCLKENIHDFDIWLNPITNGKWLIEYTKEERDFFINNFGIKEEYFYKIKTVYVKNGIEYYLSNRRFLAHDEWQIPNFSDYHFLFSNKKHIKILNEDRIILEWSNTITKEEFDECIKNKFVFICKNAYDNYYIYTQTYNMEDLYINCRNHYCYIPFRTFYSYYDQNIVQQFINQKKFYDKIKNKL